MSTRSNKEIEQQREEMRKEKEELEQARQVRQQEMEELRELKEEMQRQKEAAESAIEELRRLQIDSRQQQETPRESLTSTPTTEVAKRKTRVTFSDEAITIPKFTGEETGMPTTRWIKAVEESARRCEWNDHETLYAAKKAMRGAAKDWMEVEEELETWEEIKVALVRMFPMEVDDTQIIKRLTDVRPIYDETLTSYFQRVRKLARGSSLPQEVIRTYAIDGIEEERYRKAVLYQAKSWEDLQLKLKDYLTVSMRGRTRSAPRMREDRSISRNRDRERREGERRGSRRDNNDERRFNNGNKGSWNEAQKRSSSTPPDNGDYDRKHELPKCYNCNEIGHIGRNCPRADRRGNCFSCNKPGHRQRNCPEIKKINEIKTGDID